MFTTMNKKLIGAAMVAAMAFSSNAMASDRGVNTALGAVVGAAIGHSTGSRNGALVGGVIGAAVGNAASSRGNSYQAGYYDNGRYYDDRRYAPAPVYVQERVYHEPRRVYYEPAPHYYAQPTVVYVEKRHGRRGHHRRDYDRDDRYDRGYGYGYR